jgi:beta-1,4-mannosyltransferase
MRVAFIPVWKGNPYHLELRASLQSLGITVLDTYSLKTLQSAVAAGAEHVDVIHLHALPYFGLSPRSLARYVRFFSRLNWLRARGVRVIWTVHDFRNHDSRYWRVEDWAARRLHRKVDGVIVHGPSAKRLIEASWHRGSGQMTVIPHGHYISSYRNELAPTAAREALGLNAGATVFLFLGLIRPYKGVVELVKAFRRVASPCARLVIAGQPVSRSMERLVSNSIQGDRRILFVPGYVKDDDVQKYMNSCDVVVLPYRRVLTSGAAILAMSFGKPCIAPRLGCVTDALDEKANVLFDPSVDGDLDRALGEALSRSQELETMGRDNSRRASTWDWNSVGRATADVYAPPVHRIRKSRTG